MPNQEETITCFYLGTYLDTRHYLRKILLQYWELVQQYLFLCAHATRFLSRGSKNGTDIRFKSGHTFVTPAR